MVGACWVTQSCKNVLPAKTFYAIGGGWRPLSLMSQFLVVTFVALSLCGSTEIESAMSYVPAERTGEVLATAWISGACVVARSFRGVSDPDWLPNVAAFAPPILNIKAWAPIQSAITFAQTPLRYSNEDFVPLSFTPVPLLSGVPDTRLADNWEEELYGLPDTKSHNVCQEDYEFFLCLRCSSILKFLGVDVRKRPRDSKSRRDFIIQGGPCSKADDLMKWLPRCLISFETLEAGRKRCKVTVEFGNEFKFKDTCTSGSFDRAIETIWRRHRPKVQYEIQGLFSACGVEETPQLLFCKAVALFGYDFYCARTTLQRVIAVTRFVDSTISILPSGQTNLTKSSSKQFSKTTYEAFKDFMQEQPDNPFPRTVFSMGDRSFTVSENLDDAQVQFGCEDVILFLKGVVNSTGLNSALKLISFIYHVVFVFKAGTFDFEHLSKFTKQSAAESATGVISTVLDHLHILGTCAFEFYKTRDVNVFFRNDDTVAKYLEEAERLTAAFANMGVAEVLDVSMGQFEEQVVAHIRRGEELRSRVKAAMRPIFTSSLIGLRNMSLEVKARSRGCALRKAPFTVLVHGGPKLGKTSIISLILHQFRITNPTHVPNGLDPSGVYNRTLKEEYWSCYMNSVWAIVFDDIAQTNPKVPEFALEINEIIQVVNNVPYFVPMAALEDKGTKYVAPLLCVATTNNKDLNAAFAVRCQAAVLRRFPFVVTPTVRPEFLSDGGLDSTKAAGHTDLWTFTIEEVKLDARGGHFHEVIRSNLSTVEFLRWVTIASHAHFLAQNTTNDFMLKAKTASVCSHGVLNFMCPSCQNLVNPNGPVVNFPPPPPTAFSNYSAPSSDDLLDEAKMQFEIPAGLLVWGILVLWWYCCFIFLGFWFLLLLLIFETPSGLLRICSWVLRSFLVGVLYFPGVRGNPRTVSSVAAGGLAWLSSEERAATRPEPADNHINSFVSFFTHHIAQIGASVEGICNWHKSLLWGCWSKCCRCGTVCFQKSLGYKARFVLWCYGNPRTIVALLAVLASSAFLYFYWNNIGRVEDELNKAQVAGIAGSKPEDPAVNIVNPWNSGQPGNHTFITPSGRTGSPDSLKKLLRLQTGILRARGHHIRTLNIFGQFWLVPKHFMVRTIPHGGEVSLSRSCSLDSPAGWGFHSQIINSDDITECPSHDYVLVRLQVPPGRNLLPYCTRLPLNKRVATSLCLIREGIGFRPSHPCATSAQYAKMAPLSVIIGESTDKYYDLLRFECEEDTFNGDCGSIIASFEAGQCQIYGFFVGIVGEVQSLKIGTQLPISWLVEQLQKRDVVVMGDVELSDMSGKTYAVADTIHRKCPLNFEGLNDTYSSSILPIGEIVGVARSKFVSKVGPNKFAPFWAALGHITSKIKPYITLPWMPARLFALNVSKQKNLEDPTILRLATEHYQRRLDRLPSAEVAKVVVLDHETIMRGAANNNFMTCMNFAAGAGFPHNKPKNKLLVPISHPRFPEGTYEIDGQMRKKLDVMEEEMCAGIRPGLIFNASLKDEPISVEKAKNGKLRVFQAISFEGLYLLRKFYLSIIALFQMFNFITEASVGMDAQGQDWDELVNYMRPAEDWKLFCGDYTNYDQSISSSFLMAAWSCFIYIAKLSGNYCERALSVMLVLAMECCFPLINFFGDLICLNGSNPSGHALTVNINCVVNSLYIRYAYFKIHGTLDDFDDHVRLQTYGDDNLVSVSPTRQATFNQVTVKTVLGEIGVTYTDAQKSGEVREFVPWCEFNYLKRGAIYDEDIGGYRAPLDAGSISKMLLLGVHSCSVSEDDRLVSILQASNIEAFHHGRLFFQEHHDNILRCVEEYNLASWLALKGGLPTYEQLKAARDGRISRVARLRASPGMPTV